MGEKRTEKKRTTLRGQTVKNAAQPKSSFHSMEGVGREEGGKKEKVSTFGTTGKEKKFADNAEKERNR